jgi:hypothetical protein
VGKLSTVYGGPVQGGERERAGGRRIDRSAAQLVPAVVVPGRDGRRPGASAAAPVSSCARWRFLDVVRPAAHIVTTVS